MNPIYSKYPRTLHLNFSQGVGRDDRVLKNQDHFIGKEVVITEKLDGENTTIAHNKIYARSTDSRDHPSRHWLKAAFKLLSITMPLNYKVCGENLFAEHSIAYHNLESYFYAFSIWRGEWCLSYDATLDMLANMNIVHAPELYRGIWDESLCKTLFTNHTDKGLMEGYVVRLVDEFNISDFSISVAKFVRSGHVTTDEHWMYKPIIKNKLKIA